MPIPMTAKQQLEAARRLGHELTITSSDREAKWWIVCSCGYESVARRSVKAVNGTMAWHLGKALAASPERAADKRRNGL